MSHSLVKVIWLVKNRKKKTDDEIYTNIKILQDTGMKSYGEPEQSEFWSSRSQSIEKKKVDL